MKVSRQFDVITGLLTYIAIFGMTAVWILGWTGLSVVIGSFFNLPLKTVALVGATLGPLGFIVTLAIGFLESQQASVSSVGVGQLDGTSLTTEIDDLFT